MIYIKQFLFVLFIGLAACKQADKEVTIKTIDHESAEAINPYFTNDQKGNPVLCWTSKDPSDIYRLKYAIYDPKNEVFNDPITVSTSNNLSTSPESMGK